MAGLEFGRLDFGDDIQKPLSKPTKVSQKVSDNIAPLHSTQRKRKRSEDEDPTTSFERPTKRLREGQAFRPFRVIDVIVMMFKITRTM